MTREEFVRAVLEVAQQVERYRAGGSGRDGTCDCIGLVIGAVRRCGGTWKGTHGSNWAARHAVRELQEIRRLEPGQLVFKCRKPGETGYALPERYASSGDRRDYYHVGVVVRGDPLEIVHCTDPGPIVHDSKSGRWKVYGDLKDMETEPSKKVRKGEPCMLASVRSANGHGANLRSGSSISSKRIDQVPEGAQVTLLKEDPAWSYVSYCGKEGYMKTEFLEKQPEEEGDASLHLDRELLLRLYDACAQALGLGVG